MTDTSTPVAYLGMKKDITDATTGASIGFHKITYYTVDVINGAFSVIVKGFVSQTTYQSGLQSVNQTNTQINGKPPVGKDAEAWLYEQLSSATPASIVSAASNNLMPGMSMAAMAAPTVGAYADATLIPLQ